MKTHDKDSNRDEDYTFKADIRRDLRVFRRLNGKGRLLFVYDYYKWKILGAAAAVVCVILALSILWQGQKPVRLRVCAVLNNDSSCTDWFDSFYEQLSADGSKAAMDVDEDQPFDYGSSYSYLHEVEVMARISSGKMDAAVCGSDMLSYLLSLNACACLDEVLDGGTFSELSDKGMMVYGTAGQKESLDGVTGKSDGVDGFYAVDISETAFGTEYNKKPAIASGEKPKPLYFVIIRDNRHPEDCASLAYAITR